MNPLAVAISNQWSITAAQPSSFQTTPPALQSAVIALDASTNVGSGTGTPTAGNWLVCISGWNQNGLTAATVSDADDIHSFWRPGDVTKSQWAVSTASGKTRTSFWYTPNLLRAPADVYAAPTGVMAGMAVTVLELANLGPWDTITGISTAYAAAATSLTLSLAAPPAASAVLAAVTGDSSAVSQAFAPAGWTPIVTTTATNSTDHTCDAVLQGALLPSTTGSVSVSASAGSATDLSGVIIAFEISAPSPVPAGANASWAGRMILEAAFGSGFGTAPDQMQWTVLSDSAWTSLSQGWKRFWSFTDSTGVPYMLGQLQSGTGGYQLDNWDGALSPGLVGSSGPWSYTPAGTPSAGTYFTVTTAQAASISAGQPFTDTLNPGVLFKVTGVGAPSVGYVNVSFTPTAATVMSSADTVTQVNPQTGTPVRLRAALGTIAGTTYNRWYCFSRNALKWPEKRNKALRGFVPLSTTDAWSVASAAGPTPYRGEIEQDAPHGWWPMDDQTLAGGVQPTSLRNAAAGNSTVMSIIANPSGVGAADAYSTTGTDLSGSGLGTTNPAVPSVATSAVAQQSGWMYGDPQSSPQSSQAGGPITASPGSAAWEQTGILGNTGTQTWFLAANDTTFPGLSSGVTVKGWFKAGFLGSATGYTTTGNAYYDIAAQPVTQITLATLSTGSAPVAILYLDSSGHLILQTFVGTTGTTHSIYTSSDLRSDAWVSVDVLLTTTTYRVLVNGGLTADASGTMSAATSAWTWLTLNGDYGTAGGTSPSSIKHGGNVAYSHWAVFGSLLPAWRVRAHYCAAITGFGLLPAPQNLQYATAANRFGGQSYTPDGTEYQGSYGSTGFGYTSYTFSAVAAAVAGSYTSGPSARLINAGFGVDNGGVYYGQAVWIGVTALAPSVQLFTAASAAAETEASTICGSGDSFTSGYGSGASGHGVCHTAGGTGASPPTSASSLGDTVAQRVERILGYAGMTGPRAIDSTASLLVQAANDIGGQSAGSNLQNVVNSDNGFMFVDSAGVLCYRSRPHLAADATAWYIGMNTAAGQVPFDGTIGYSTDPQKAYTDILITPYSPDGSTLPAITPSSASAVTAAQEQVGTRPYTVTSYLQSETEQQSQANWLFTTYGTPVRRVESVTINAATHPAGWGLWFGLSIGDVVQIYDAPFGGPSFTGTFRVTQASRSIAYGANGSAPEAKLTLALDPVPASYWS